MTALGRKIEELLAARGWNQARLADEHPDLQRSTVSRSNCVDATLSTHVSNMLHCFDTRRRVCHLIA